MRKKMIAKIDCAICIELKKWALSASKYSDINSGAMKLFCQCKFDLTHNQISAHPIDCGRCAYRKAVLRSQILPLWNPTHTRLAFRFA